MKGIEKLQVDTNAYVGEISILADIPQVHVILSSDTFFLDNGFENMRRGRELFRTQKDPRKSVAFLSKREQLIDGLSVADNIFLRYSGSLFISRKSRLEYCEALYREIGYELPTGADVRTLTLSQRRFVEFYQLLFQEPEIAVINEVTANLSYKELFYLDRILERLIRGGTLVIFLTTRCEEALRIGDVFHIYINGEERSLLLREQMQQDPRELYRRFLGLEGGVLLSENASEEQWLHFLTESMHIENHVLRVNSVLEGYCSRIRGVLRGSYCRLYYGKDGSLPYHVASGDAEEICSPLTPRAFRLFQEYPFLIINERDAEYASLFGPGKRPVGILMSSLNHGEEHLAIEVGTEQIIRELPADQYDFLQRTTIEIAVFIENSRLRNELLILQESNHRIKNNIQMFLSYVNIQRQSIQNRITNEEDLRVVNDSFREMENRMLAYYRLQNALSEGEFMRKKEGLPDLIQEVYQLYEEAFLLETEIEDIPFSRQQLMALGIIFNELMNNTAKHNEGRTELPEAGDRLRVWIRVGLEENTICARYRDNGIMDPDAMQSGSGVGLRLIRNAVANDLKGTCEIGGEKSFSIRITMPYENRV